ncbi:hypothetical protein [Allokutzneria oryzae]|uniref:Uncharacterized protein n=1 Tax=Allokutzneria oryzae TaxID=1378989 RepID=A0ABV6A509_9PSEU
MTAAHRVQSQCTATWSSAGVSQAVVGSGDTPLGRLAQAPVALAEDGGAVGAATRRIG